MTLQIGADQSAQIRQRHAMVKVRVNGREGTK